MKKSIEITPAELLEAVNKAINGENMQKLTKKAPMMSLVFTTFGMELIRVLFDIKEDKQ